MSTHNAFWENCSYVVKKWQLLLTAVQRNR